MAEHIYKEEDIFEIHTANGEKIHLYVEKQNEGRNEEYHCIAYKPDTYQVLNNCIIKEEHITTKSAAENAAEIMQISVEKIEFFTLNNHHTKVFDTVQEPDIKVQLLKTLANEISQQNYESEVIGNILEIIKLL